MRGIRFAGGFAFAFAFALALALATVTCGRHEPATSGERAGLDTAAASAVARDRSERLAMPLARSGVGGVVMQAVAEERGDLDAVLAPGRAVPSAPAPDLPAAEPGEPPAPDPPAFVGPGAVELKPPIPRGAPSAPRGGRGGKVTFDVRVDEAGGVSDVELVATDADSASVQAASAAAFATLYHPALLGSRRIAVWTRMVFDVQRARGAR